MELTSFTTDGGAMYGFILLHTLNEITGIVFIIFFVTPQSCVVMKNTQHCHIFCPHCIECHRQVIDTKLYPCCHVRLCRRCAEDLMNTTRPCPICNKPIEDISPAVLF